MDVTDLRHRQEVIEDRIFHAQRRLRTALSRARGKVDYQRQTLLETRHTAARVALGAGIGILISFLAAVFGNRRSYRPRVLHVSRVSRRYEPRFEGRRLRGRFEERERFFDDYPAGHREPIPRGYGRRLSHDLDEEDHEWARYPGRR